MPSPQQQQTPNTDEQRLQVSEEQDVQEDQIANQVLLLPETLNPKP